MITKEDINLIRDAAIALEQIPAESKIKLSLMQLAQKLRPNGEFIKEKLSEYEYKKIKPINNSKLNIHFGVHKTATTYIQRHIQADPSEGFQYLPLDVFRDLREQFGLNQSLRQDSWHNWRHNTLISDENLLSPALLRSSSIIYPNAKERITNVLKNFVNKKDITVYITLRPMCDFLPSFYCQLLRHRKKFISYEDWAGHLSLDTLSWHDTFNESILRNHKVNFILLDYMNFSDKSSDFINALTFGNFKNPHIKTRPLASFTNKELRKYSGSKTLFPNNNDKFNPYSTEMRTKSYQVYREDLSKLSQHKNVTFL